MHRIPFLLEPLQFSKEKYLIDSPPEKLRRELEEELKLSSSDPRSHGWYHGRIPRECELRAYSVHHSSSQCQLLREEV
ncbi:SH2 domain-containing protein 3C [Acipenser ruthenus]|uniref:SH2 domain-containing protein 3C n=1 Tax=Acipenser ruthenus TaxID=7906 RepID=A0A444UYM9_ACIRT|nr:SH2 domain-containing protein 3C [Acipenser ruthenus]